MRTQLRFINVPSDKSGKTITGIKYLKGKVVAFFDGEPLELTEDTFSSYLLYVNKTISTKELNKIKKENAQSKILDYALKLCGRGLYSKNEVIKRLEAKKASKSQIDYVIKYLLSNKLIDDVELAKELLSQYALKGFGKNKINQNLYLKGISKEDIEQIDFNEQDEIDKANQFVENTIEKYSNLPSKAKKEKLYLSLCRQGFESDVALNAISNIKENSPTKEAKLCKVDYELVHNKLSKIYKGSELKQRIIKALLAKGYSYNQIKLLERD